MKFERLESGEYRDIWVERKPLETEAIEEVQQRLIEQGVTPPEDPLHLTDFYLGDPDSIFADLNHANTNLKKDHFLNFLVGTLTTANWDQEPITLDLKRLASRQHRTSLVLKFMRTPELMESRADPLGAIEQLLIDCGIENPVEYMEKSSRFRYNTEKLFMPHVTLGYFKLGNELPRLDVPPMRVTFGPSELMGVLKD